MFPKNLKEEELTLKIVYDLCMTIHNKFENFKTETIERLDRLEGEKDKFEKRSENEVLNRTEPSGNTNILLSILNQMDELKEKMNNYETQASTQYKVTEDVGVTSL